MIQRMEEMLNGQRFDDLSRLVAGRWSMKTSHKGFAAGFVASFFGWIQGEASAQIVKPLDPVITLPSLSACIKQAYIRAQPNFSACVTQCKKIRDTTQISVICKECFQSLRDRMAQDMRRCHEDACGGKAGVYWSNGHCCPRGAKYIQSRGVCGSDCGFFCAAPRQLDEYCECQCNASFLPSECALGTTFDPIKCACV